MDAQIDAPTEVPVPLDAQAREVLLLAAQLGAQITDDVFVSYTTLLLGVLFAKLDHDQTHLPSTVQVTNIAAWQVEANRALNVANILSQKAGLERGVADKLALAIRTGELRAWPSGRTLLSISAHNVLQESAKLALEQRGPQDSVTPADIMASYVSVIPAAHRRQAESWGLVGTPAERIRVLLPVPKTSEPEPGELPGFDRAASAAMKSAFALASNWRGVKKTLLASEVLLVALVETAPQLADADAAEAAVLREMLHATETASAYARRRNTTFEIPSNLAGAAATTGNEQPTTSPNGNQIIEAARGFAVSLSRSEIVSLRHLIAALVCSLDGTVRSSVAADWLDEAGVAPDVLGSALIDVIRSRHPGDNLAAWRDLLLGRELNVVATARPDTIPCDPRPADRLGLRRYADAIGALISASKQKPPLSIAVFGSWGSGKSFFMKMIKAAVNDFATAGGDAFKASIPTPFLRRVVQIEFNAWHYAEGNLWASLVHAILVGLQRKLAPADDSSAFEHLLNKLHLREAASAEALAKQREAERQLEESQAALDKMEQELAQRRTREASVPRAADVIWAVQREALSALKPPGNSRTPDAWIKSVGASVISVAAYLGRPELAQQVPDLQAAANDAAAGAKALEVTVGDIRDLLDEAHATTDRGLSFVGWLANAQIDPAERTKVLLLGGGGMCVLVLVALLFGFWGAQIAAAISAIAAFIVPLVGTATVAIGWARRHLSEATRAFSTLGSIRGHVEALQAQRLATRDAQLVAAQRATAEAEAEAVRRRADAEAARVAVERAKAEVKAATGPERLKQFVAQRLAEGDYQRHLGLVHTIRGDLERLEGILLDVPPLPADNGAEPPVQRVVLYIDDLDRCAPARVVEVLEAVHLLLAFKLFVVVVGVDIRWVAQALRRRYPLQLGDRPGIASPIDYLEKVFQIPFWLPAMDPVAGRRLLEAAIVEEAAEPPPPQTVPAQPNERAVAESESHPADLGGADAAPTMPVEPAPAPQPADARAVAEALVLGRLERERLVSMAAAVGASPRRAKRFANTYLLLKASLSAGERRGFVFDDGKAGSFEGALLLLAAATGAPRATRALITLLAEDPGSDLAAYLQTRFAQVEPSVQPEERRAFDAVQTMALGTHDKAGLIRHLRVWAPGVTRFVFAGQD